LAEGVEITSELGAFAPWREEYPNPRSFDFRNTSTARYEKHVGVSFWIAIQSTQTVFYVTFVLFVVRQSEEFKCTKPLKKKMRF
jgi:hypothetical protein